MVGTLYGVGVGPGDPELLTLKAVHIIKESPVIAVPGKTKESSVAYQIAKQVVPEIDKKTIISIEMPMIKDDKKLEAYHKEGVKNIQHYLKQGLQVAFLTIGDVSIYSTYLYLHRLVKQAGFPVEMVSGIPSFCAAAAKLNIGLVEKAESLHIIAASYPIEEALELAGTKVFMKSGKQIAAVKQVLQEKQCKAVMIENCGMQQEKIYYSVEEMNEQAGYYSLIIVKEES